MNGTKHNTVRAQTGLSQRVISVLPIKMLKKVNSTATGFKALSLLHRVLYLFALGLHLLCLFS